MATRGHWGTCAGDVAASGTVAEKGRSRAARALPLERKMEPALELWRKMFTDRPRRPRGRGRDLSRVVKTQFRAPPDVKTKRELDDTSSVVTGAESVGVLSRPESRVSRSSSCWTTRSGRDWYNPDNWRHGGLRYKFSCFGFYTLDILSGVFF